MRFDRPIISLKRQEFSQVSPPPVALNKRFETVQRDRFGLFLRGVDDSFSFRAYLKMTI